MFLDKLYLSALIGRLKSLILLAKFENVITDIKTALKLSSDNLTTAELFAWLFLSYQALNENSKAQVALNLTKKLTPDNKDINNILKQSFKVKTTSTEKSKCPKISDHKHNTFQCASKKLRLMTSQEKGRYFVAAEEIKTGEILIVEPAAVSCLLPEKFGTHCHHCFERYVQKC